MRRTGGIFEHILDASSLVKLWHEPRAEVGNVLDIPWSLSDALYEDSRWIHDVEKMLHLLVCPSGYHCLEHSVDRAMVRSLTRMLSAWNLPKEQRLGISLPSNPPVCWLQRTSLASHHLRG